MECNLLGQGSHRNKTTFPLLSCESRDVVFTFFFLSFTFYKHPFLYVVNEQLEANIFCTFIASSHELISTPVLFSTLPRAHFYEADVFIRVVVN